MFEDWNVQMEAEYKVLPNGEKGLGGREPKCGSFN